MKNRILPPALIAELIFLIAFCSIDIGSASASSSLNTKTLVLYEAAAGTIPSAPLLDFIDFPTNAALPTYSDGSTVMDTAASGNETYAGWIATDAGTPGFPILDRTAGFQMNFTLRVENESHARNNRAGLSVIVLSEDAKGIELAFWNDQIWAQGDEDTGGLFAHAEGIVFSTTADLTEYQLKIVGDTYTLSVNDEPILTGPLRDYSGFDGFPDPYETSNFIFLGDDTTSAQARVHLSYVSITGTEPPESLATSTVTSSSSPFPTASSTPPEVVSTPSPTPAGKPFTLCPSGWIFLTVMLTVLWTIKKIRMV